MTSQTKELLSLGQILFNETIKTSLSRMNSVPNGVKKGEMQAKNLRFYVEAYLKRKPTI